jgi:molecular chaperone DnaK
MKKAIGIDLGTTNSVVAFKDTVVKILRNKENEELTRSCIGQRNGEILVGRPAYQLLERDPVNTILSVKRLMGGAIKDRMVQDMLTSSYYKYGIAPLKGGTEEAVAVVLGGKQYTPEQISAEILKKLKQDAEEKLGDDVTHAVITVPAYFTEKQKNATRMAAQYAGLKVQKLLAEPTAAAIAYGVDNIKGGDAKTVLIYDFGGGTFDLSILNIVDGQYMEAGTGGDRWLGGDDIDKKLQEIIFNKVQEEYNINDINELISSLPEKKRFQFEGQLRFKTEEAKLQLSSTKTASIIIDGILEDENGDWIDIDVTISRDEFENSIRPFVQRSINLISELLKEVGYDMTMVDAILLVGGTSCIPLVKQMLSAKFGAEKINVSEKPMLAVAEGAAILAHRLGDEYESPEETSGTIADISYSTNHNYFIQLQDKEEKIIDKQMPLPINITRSFKTSVNNQKVAEICLLADVEGGSLEQQTIGYYAIDEDLPAGSELTFNVEMDLDERFTIRVHPKGSKGKEKSIVLGRGNKDSKALKFISESFRKIISGDYSEQQKDYFFKAAKKEIEKINSLGITNPDSVEWERIGTNIYSAFDQAEQVSDEMDEDGLAVIFAKVLCGQYPALVGSTNLNKMQGLIRQIDESDDSLVKSELMQRLKVITDEFSVLVTLFTVKLSADSAAKVSPADANRLHQLHDQIVNHFRNGQMDAGFELLDEALTLGESYGSNGIDVGSVYLN